MRKSILAVFAYTICAVSLLAQDQTGAPLHLEENPHSINATNISTKPIVFVAIATVLSANAPAKSAMLSTHDWVFKSMMAPGEMREVVHPQSDDATITGPDGKQAPLPPPPAYGKSSVVFVQFADGTTWGTPNDHINHLLAARKGKLQFFDDLLAAYTSAGDSGFASRLKSELESAGQWRTPAGHLLRMHDDSGSDAAIRELRQLVNNGHARTNLMP